MFLYILQIKSYINIFEKRYYSYFCFFISYKLVNLIEKSNNILL